MFLLKWNYLLLLFIFHGYYCQRRITDGADLTIQKKYMVYLLKASVSDKFYEKWLCGGALVSTEYIVTSAACIADVPHLYAIAGYDKYISDTEIHTDPCTKEKKKKIVYTCLPKDYEMDYHDTAKWTYIDIALVKVESPYDFNDASYADVCSYTPAAIAINYESKFQEPGIDAIVLGWGHETKYREDMDLADFNVEKLKYAPVLLENKENCKKEYAVYEGMNNVIDRYMICTAETGNLDAAGVTIVKSPPIAQGCQSTNQKLRVELSCETDAKNDNIVLVQNARKDIKLTNLTNNNATQEFNDLTSERKGSSIDLNSTHKSAIVNKLNETVVNSRRLNTRRFGICQNDHGGPLVTWVGAHEVLIGVASAYKITEDRECTGPYLYTSTQCNGAFLDCVVKSDPGKTDRIRRALCDNLLNETGIQLVETHISWKDHQDGLADNEKNGTEHASDTNKINKGTLKLQDSKDDKNKTHQEHNTTKLVNTNVTNANNTTPTHHIENSILTSTSKTVNVSDSTNTTVNNINTANVTKSAKVMLISELQDSKDDKHKPHQEHNTTKLVNTNVTNANNTTPTHHIENSTLTSSSKTVNVSDSTNTTVNNINTANVTKSAKVMLISELQDSKDDKNKTHQEHNTTKLVNINVTNANNTTPTHHIENSTLTSTSKTVNVSDSTNTTVNNINSANVTKSAKVMLISDNSTDLHN